MNEIRHRHRILEAIDQLRRRKARPDVNRICSFMFRRFSVTCGETKSDLQKLIDAEIVIKVDYKGNTSYRNAAKWAMLPNYKSRQELDSTTVSSIVSSAVAELIVLEPDYLDIGVPANELERHLLKKYSRNFTRKNLEIVLRKELDYGALVKLENGNYYLGEHTTSTPRNSSPLNIVNTSPTKLTSRPTQAKPAKKANSSPKPNKIKKTTKPTPPPSKPAALPPRPVKTIVPVPEIKTSSAESVDSSPSKPSTPSKPVEHKEEQKVKMEENSSNSNSSSTANCENGNVGFRVGGRQKRAKVMFDPSDNNLPKGRRKTVPKDGRPSTGSSSAVKPVQGGREHSTSAKHSSSLNSSTSSNSGNGGGGGSANTPIKETGGNTSSSNGGDSASTPHQNSKCSVTPSSVVASNYLGTSERLVKTFHLPQNVLPVNPGVCLICHSYGQRVKGVPERLVSCSDCTKSKAHPSCVDSGKEGSCRGRNGLWQCFKCKTCTVCEENSKAGLIAVCVKCGDGYHSFCHTPQIPMHTPNMTKWRCFSCLRTEVKEETPSTKEEPPEDGTNDIKDIPMIDISSPPKKTEKDKSGSCTPVSSASSSPTLAKILKSDPLLPIAENSNVSSVMDSVRTNSRKNSCTESNNNERIPMEAQPSPVLQDPYEGYPIDDSIPDASLWSPQEVFQYFIKFFDADLAQVFKDQEIDGQSLLLMKRTDVLSGLCLKLGPALKVYSHVKKLQIRRSHPKLIWS